MKQSRGYQWSLEGREYVLNVCNLLYLQINLIDPKYLLENKLLTVMQHEQNFSVLCETDSILKKKSVMSSCLHCRIIMECLTADIVSAA